MSFVSLCNSLGGISKYRKEQVIFEKDIPGTYNINILENGIYYVEMVGGGGGGANSDGGAGATFLGNIYIPSGTYTIQVGAGGRKGNRNNNAYPGTSSSISNIIVCGNGFAGKGQRVGAPYRESQGGDFTILNSKFVLQPENGAKGNNGSIHYIPARVLSNFTPNPILGSGGGSMYLGTVDFGDDGYHGYVKITFKQ